MNELQIGIINLVKSALTDETVSMPENFDWDLALKLGKKHQILPMLHVGVLNSELNVPAELMKKLEITTYANIVVSQKQLYAIDEICKVFSENGIDYMPLKGSVLKHIYPKPELRPMSDADILIRVEQHDKIRPLMTELGFTETIESDHEFVWNKDSILQIELHKRLIPSYNKDYYEYYGDGWRLARQADNFRYEMRHEDNFIYIFTHYAKHYRDGGIGIRHITDIYVLSTAYPELDYNYIEEELKKLQLLEFYKNTKHTLDVWFDGDTPDAMSDFITSKIFGSGSYGTQNAKLLSAAVKTSGSDVNEANVKRSLLKSKLFPPHKVMAARYKCLEKHPSLLPLMWVVRAVHMPFRKGRLKANIETAKATAPDKVIAYRDELDAVGLKFNFEE